VPDPYAWEVPSVGDARFTWEYDELRARLLSLTRRVRTSNGTQSRIDWSLDVDPTNPVGVPDQFHPLFGSPIWRPRTRNGAPSSATTTRPGTFPVPAR
jgi:hypothetical protein